MELNDAIQSRKSIRKFKSEKPDYRKIIECIDAVRFSPTAGNNNTIKIILVDDKEKIQKIAQACQQDFVAQAQYIVIVCSNKERLVNAYEKRGEKFNKQQIGAAIENFLLKIQEAGLSTCWIGYFLEDMIKRELGIPDNIEVEALFPIGYEYEKSFTQKHKIDLDAILYFNNYGEVKMRNPNRVD